MAELRPVTDWSWESADGVFYVERSHSGQFTGYIRGVRHCNSESLQGCAEVMGVKIAEDDSKEGGG